MKLKYDKINGAGRLYDVLLKNIQKMLNGELTPQQVLDYTEVDGKKIIAAFYKFKTY